MRESIAPTSWWIVAEKTPLRGTFGSAFDAVPGTLSV